ncbi:hypothetical protein BH10PSE17_BH10PSE17_35700 [soil metagenome]
MGLNYSQFLGSLAGTVLCGAALLVTHSPQAADTPTLATLDVGRINVREPDGTLRMVISNADSAPGIIVRGQERPHPSRRSAGLLFFNDEGTENGGLIFDGRRAANGEPSGGGSLTFDRLEQDQVVQMVANEQGQRRSAGLIVSDRPDGAMDLDAIERAGSLTGAEQAAAFRKANAVGVQRAFIGRAEDGSAELALRDAKGARRIVMSVAADGTSTIRFLGADGRVSRTLP